MKRWHVYGLLIGITGFLGGTSYMQLPEPALTAQCADHHIQIIGSDVIFGSVFVDVDNARFELTSTAKSDGWVILNFTDMDGVKMVELRATKGHLAASIVKDNVLQHEVCEVL